MDDGEAEIRELKRLVQELLARVSRLEKLAGVAGDPRQAAQSHARPVPLEVVPAPGERAPQPRSNLEARIGSHWLNRIGIAALLIGVSYFLKYAFESNWIGPAGQIVIGLVAGVAVVVWSEWFRSRGYQAFSYSLKAVGIGACYLSLWAAFQIYHLVPVEVAFAAMVVLTAMTGILAVVQNGEILGALALAGGFATPILISSGRNHELQLFSYLALLDLATLFMIFARAWRRLLLMSFAGTAALYFVWYAEFYSSEQFAITFFFATLFFAIFAMAATMGRGSPGSAVSRALLLIVSLNGVVYLVQACWLLQTSSSRAWFAAVLGVVYLMLAWPERLQPQLGGSHLALGITFFTVAIALWLQQAWISLGWFAEAAVLMAGGFWRDRK